MSFRDSVASKGTRRSSAGSSLRSSTASSMGVKVGAIQEANFPKDHEGRVYHLGLRKGEICNRIISVGDAHRARSFAELLDNTETCFVRASNRGFVTYTGLYDGVPVSIVATGMGYPMMDFVVRETRALIDGEVLILRLGTCGALTKDVQVGDVLVADQGSLLIQRSVDSFTQPGTSEYDYYHFSNPVHGDDELLAAYKDELSNVFGKEHVKSCMNATADTFFASQGRVDPHFYDHNSNLLYRLVMECPGIKSMEMETFHLYHLANCAVEKVPIRAGSACIVAASRLRNNFIEPEYLKQCEVNCGLAALRAITRVELPEEQAMTGPECVWLQTEEEKIPTLTEVSEEDALLARAFSGERFNELRKVSSIQQHEYLQYMHAASPRDGSPTDKRDSGYSDHHGEQHLTVTGHNGHVVTNGTSSKSNGH
eukprot:Clim_evm77s128 gene=Clim_evmTU77s128